MKILQAFDILSSQTNGTVALVSQLSKALSERGQEVAIYTSDFQLEQEYIDSLPDVKVYPFHNWLNLPGVHLMPGIVMEVKRKLKEFDIVHIHEYRSFQNVVICYYAKKYGVPYVLDTHGSLPRAVGGEKGLKWLLKWLFDIAFGYRILKGASRVIAQNELAISEYKEAGINQDKIALLPLLFDTEEFSQLPPFDQFRNKYGIKEKHIVMFLGRINWIKGLDFLVKSFYELTRLRDDVILAIVGPDDGYKATLAESINRLNLSNRVLFTGFLSVEDKFSALVDADVVVQPSRYEQAAWAPIEAVLCGTPIIVSKHTGAGDDVSRLDAGYLVEYGNKKELVEIIQKILDDPSEARTKTNKAREFIRANLSLTKGIEDYEKLYMECIKETGQLRSKK